jgi:hypothetical protein
MSDKALKFLHTAVEDEVIIGEQFVRYKTSREAAQAVGP